MLPLNNTIHTVSTRSYHEIPPENKNELIKEWELWSENGIAGYEDREMAFKELKECLHYNRNTLDLTGLGLISLPNTLPPSLTKLYVYNNQLTCLPEILPPSLTILDVDNNELTCLPNTLPTSLTKLYADNNYVTCLPDMLPPSLTVLNVNKNTLTRLPSMLPSSLTILNANNNKLTRLPDTLPPSLTILNINNNELTCLPNTLPPALIGLDANENELEALPNTLPTSLIELHVRSNHLTCLPDTLPAALTLLNVDDNKLEALPNTLPASLIELHVHSNHLTCLPDTLPSSLIKLYAYNNQLTCLPDTLPSSLTELSVVNNRLTSLPDTLPVSLTVLKAFQNQLTYLPVSLPPSLSILNVNHNQLTYLPSVLPSSITTLSVNYNQLTHLPPTLPLSLTVLYANNNRLTYLPPTLCPSLVILEANNNQLTSLPDRLPRSLIELSVSYNQLTSVPNIWPLLSLLSLRELNISYNRITAFPHGWPNQLRILDICGNPLSHFPENLPRFIERVLSDFDQSQIQVHDPELLFTDIILLWNKNINIDQWKKIELENNAKVFGKFLKKLYQGKNIKNQLLINQVANWLNYLEKEKNSDLRRLIFLIAQDVTEDCVDRASFYFNKMHTLMLENELVKMDTSINTLFKTNQSLFRMQILEKIASQEATARQKQSPGFEEDIEIYLAYQYKLREILSLPIYTEVHYEDISSVKEEDVEKAKSNILNEEKANFLRYLVTESSSWNAYIERWNREKKQSVDDSYLEEITSYDFQKKVTHVIKKQNLSTKDEEIRHGVSKKMAANLLFQKRYELTKECLIEYGALSLIVPFDPNYLEQTDRRSDLLNNFMGKFRNKLRKL